MKIVIDTGYENVPQFSRCYYVSVRTVGFDNDTSPEEIQAFVDAEKKAWYGQEFSAQILKHMVHIRRGVDSGD